jgi:hypothetical protein
MRLVVVILLCFVAIGNTCADSYALIVGGSGGDAAYQSKFEDWGTRLQRALIDIAEFRETHVVRMMENIKHGTQTHCVSTIENLKTYFDQTAQKITNDDIFFVFLIGHGSYLREISKFHLPGPDLTAAELNTFLANVNAKLIVVVNASSSSAGFINELSGLRRVICTATHNVNEINATEFMEFFLCGLEEGSADQNRDERVSVLEACRQAALLTEQWYGEQGLLATEHAILDDNGDGLGTRLFVQEEDRDPSALASHSNLNEDGAIADRCFIKEFSFPPAVPRELIDTYLSLMNQIDDWKRKKSSMEVDPYYQELETLLIEAAKTNRAIKRHFANHETSAQ